MPISRDLLETQVAGTPYDGKYAGLLKLLRGHPDLAAAKVVATRDGYSNVARRCLVIGPEGESLGELADWSRRELEDHGGDFRAVWRKHSGGPLRLANCCLNRIYISAQTGPKPQDFVQVVVWVAHHEIDQPLYDKSSWHEPRCVEDLIDDCARHGDRIEPPVPFGPPRYELESLHRIADVIATIEMLDEARKHRYDTLQIVTTDDRGVERSRGYYGKPPDLRHLPSPAVRLFEDWTESSAGRSGAVLSDFWAIDVRDYTDQRGERSVSIVPVWTHTKNIAALKTTRTMSDCGVWDLAHRFDTRIGHPMAWYFYMLHGNLVRDWCGERILEAAENGLIVLPEDDYSVLKRWREHGYWF
jgi:hypothetical protein